MSANRLCLLHFSEEIVAMAMLRKAPAGIDMEHQYEELVQLARDGWFAATECVHCVAFTYLWDEFGRS
jgi:hypothetical protein